MFLSSTHFSSGLLSRALLSRAATIVVVCALAVTTTAAYAAPKPSEKQSASKNIASGPSFDLNEQGVEAIRQKDFVRAEQLFKKSLEADSGNLTAAFNYSGMLINNKRQTDAIELLTGYIAKFKDDAGLFVRRGDAFFSVKDVKAALSDYEKALQLEPKYEGLPAKLSTVYALTNRTKDAERVLLMAVEQDPKNAQLLQNLSNIFLVNGDAEKAISTAKLALQISPSSELYVTLGNAYENKRDFKNSLIAFERALDLGDKRPELQEKIEALKKVQS